MAALFDLGRVVATPGALEVLASAATSPAALLERHVSRDWGEVSSEDARENACNVRNGWRVLSSGLLLPEDY